MAMPTLLVPIAPSSPQIGFELDSLMSMNPSVATSAVVLPSGTDMQSINLPATDASPTNHSDSISDMRATHSVVEPIMVLGLWGGV